MVFLSHGVVASGRIHHKPKKQLEKRRLTKLRENIPLLNKVGKLLREREIKRKVFIYGFAIYYIWLSVQNVVGKLKDMKKDGIVAHTAGQSYSLIALSATNNLRRCGVTAPTVGNPNRKIKVFPFG